jgi:hypothetical protein
MTTKIFVGSTTSSTDWGWKWPEMLAEHSRGDFHLAAHCRLWLARRERLLNSMGRLQVGMMNRKIIKLTPMRLRGDDEKRW